MTMPSRKKNSKSYDEIVNQERREYAMNIENLVYEISKLIHDWKNGNK
jgi:hypothetical protein